MSMRHLGPESVRREIKGMVERCADCGFDLAGGLVEVVPTAHYMMGGVEFAADCTTVLPGLFVAGEDSGGVHGANRLGGNGVANSTVFGAVAGDSMARFNQKEKFREPDRRAIDAAVARCERAFAAPAGDLEALRERLYDTMWERVGILRDASGLSQALAELDALDAELLRPGVVDTMRAVVLTTEEEGIGLAAGAWLGGEKTALLMQSSGVGNLVNVLGMVQVCRFPLLMLVTMRGEQGEFNPWQVPMGQTTARVLEAMGVAVRQAGEPETVAAHVHTALRLAFEAQGAAAVLIAQRVIGIKSFQEQSAQ